MKGKLSAVAVIAALFAGYAQAQQGVPTMMIPFTETPPTIDGVIDPDEWAGAAAVTGFVVPGNAMLTPPGGVVYMMHDWENIYFAFRSNLLPNQVPSRRYRKRDEPVFMDRNQIELWLTAPIEDAKTWAYQFIGNAYGAIFDNLQHPELGVINAGWDGNWTFKNTWVEGEYWDAELSIPTADLGIPRISPGQVWRGMVGIAWPQRSWPYTGGWYKNLEMHAKFVMGADSASVQTRGVDTLLHNKLDLEVAINAGQAGQYTADVKIGDLKKSAVVRLQAGATGGTKIESDLPDTNDPRTMELLVKAPDGSILFEGEWKFRPGMQLPSFTRSEPVLPFPTQVNYALETKAIRIWADVLEYDKRDQLAAAVITVHAEGNPGRQVGTARVTSFDYDQVEQYIWLEGVTPGKYAVRFDFVDAEGKLLDSKTDGFEDLDLPKEFIWYNNNVGMNYTFGEDFGPIKREGNRLSIWGRTYSFENGPLLSQVSSQNASILSRPISLVVVRGNNRTVAEPVGGIKFTSVNDKKVTFEGEYRAGDVRANLTGYFEFDGMVYYTLTTTAGQPVDALYISMPVNTENAPYFYSTAGGWSGASMIIEDTPAQDTALWTSAELSDFVPFGGLTDDDRALVWFADNDHNWILGQDKACMELWKHANEVELRINLVRTAGSVPNMENVGFGFIATPVKPLPETWRNPTLHFSPMNNSKINFFYGEGHGGGLGLHDSAKLLEHLKVEIPQGKSADEVLANLPREVQGTVDRTSSPGEVLFCPFHNARMYFEGTRSRAFRVFFPGDWREYPPGGWFHLSPVKSYQDFYLWYFDKWVKHINVRSVYFDEVYAPKDHNIFNGSGKIMPDGSVRPSVNLMHQRQYMRRVRQVFLDNNVKPFIWVHTSNYMAPQAISWTDIAMFGEDRGPTATIDFIETAPETIFRTIGRSQKFGMIPFWMNMTGRGGVGAMHFLARQTMGWPWMFDTASEMHTGVRGRWEQALRVAWGIDQNDVNYFPYWRQTMVKTNDENFIASVWTRPGTALVQVFNLNRDPGKTRVQLTIDPQALGLGANVRIYDLESEPTFAPLKAETLIYDAGQLPADLVRALQNRLSTPRVDVLDLTRLKAAGDARTATINIGPRDFLLLVIK